MTIPLMLLAVLSIAGGWVGLPKVFFGDNAWSHFMEPVFAAGEAAGHSAAEAHDGSMEITLMAISVVVSLLGIAAAWDMYGRGERPVEKSAAEMSPLHRLLANKYYMDEIYTAVFVKPALYLSRDVFWRAVDQWLIDGAVNGAASGAQGFGSIARRLQSGNIRSYAGWVLAGAVLLIGYMVAYSG